MSIHLNEYDLQRSSRGDAGDTTRTLCWRLPECWLVGSRWASHQLRPRQNSSQCKGVSSKKHLRCKPSSKCDHISGFIHSVVVVLIWLAMLLHIKDTVTYYPSVPCLCTDIRHEVLLLPPLQMQTPLWANVQERSSVSSSSIGLGGDALGSQSC